MRAIRAVAALLLALALSGCGYALVGRGVIVDPTIKKVGVPLFKDGTGKAGLDQKITEKVIEELLKRGRFDVVQERQGVNALVEGELVGYNNTPVGFSDAGLPTTPTTGTTTTTQATRYSITLRAKVRYTKVGVDEPIWANDSFFLSEEYDLGTDPSAFFDREEQALERLTEAFSRSLVAAMLEAF